MLACAVSGTEGGEICMGGNSLGAVRLWGARSGLLLHHMTVQTRCKVHACAFLGGGLGGNETLRIATGGTDRQIRLFDLRSSGSRSGGTEHQVAVAKVGSTVQSLSASRDKNMLASGHVDGSVRFHLVDGLSQVHLSSVHAASVTSVQFSPHDANYVLSASRDNSLVVLDTRTFGPVCTLRAKGFKISSDLVRGYGSCCIFRAMAIHMFGCCHVP